MLTNLGEITPTLDLAKLPVILSADDAKQGKAKARLLRRVEKRRFTTIDKHEIAVQHLDPLPGPNESLHGVIGANYSGWHLATAAIDLLAMPIEEMLVCTLGINRANISDLCELLDTGRVQSVTVLLSHYFRGADQTIYRDAKRELESRGQTIIIARSHAKMILLRAGQRHICVETSANLRSSVNIEQFVVNDDPALFQFHRGWIHQLLEGTT